MREIHPAMVMRDHHNGALFLHSEPPQNVPDVLAGLGIHGGGRLIREHDPRVRKKRAGDSNPLFFSTAKLIGLEMKFVAQT